MPLYVRTPGEVGAGNAALVAEGALPFTLTPDSTDTLIGLFGAQAVSQPLFGDETADAQQSLERPLGGAWQKPSFPSRHLFRCKRNCRRSQDLRNWRCIRPQPPICWRGLLLEEFSRTTGPTIDEQPTAEQPVPVVSSGFALDMYADFSAKLAPLLRGGALSEEEISTLLCIEKSQAKAWLKRASEAGLVENSRSQFGLLWETKAACVD